MQALQLACFQFASIGNWCLRVTSSLLVCLFITTRDHAFDVLSKARSSLLTACDFVPQVFDHNCDGYISKRELFDTMKQLGIKLTLEDLNEMMKQADINGDGKIDYSGRSSSRFLWCLERWSCLLLFLIMSLWSRRSSLFWSNFLQIIYI